MNIAPCRISRGHCGLPLEGTTSRTYRLCMYVKTSKTLPFTLLLSLPLLFSLLLGPPRLLSFRYASTVAPRPRSSTTTTDPPIYLSYVRVSILDTRNAYVFPVRESRPPFIFPRFPLSPCPSYSPRGNQFPFATQPISSPIIVTTYLHADISSYARFVNRIRETRLARSIPLDRAVLPFRVHFSLWESVPIFIETRWKEGCVEQSPLFYSASLLLREPSIIALGIPPISIRYVLLCLFLVGPTIPSLCYLVLPVIFENLTIDSVHNFRI